MRVIWIIFLAVEICCKGFSRDFICGPYPPWTFSHLSFSQINSSICLLRGKIYDAMDNRPLATSSYKEALKLDVYCFEAFDLLTSHHMLTAQEGETGAWLGMATVVSCRCRTLEFLL